MWSCNPKLEGNTLAYDVTFRFNTESFSCEQSVFGPASLEFKQIFDAVSLDLPLKNGPGYAAKVYPNTKNVTIEFDEPLESLEVIHKLLHNPKCKIEPYLLPSVYKVARIFKFENIRQKIAILLAKAISLENIGQVCPLVNLSFDQLDGGAVSEDTASRDLAIAIKNFMVSHADAIASSQTGQLSARLFIDVLEDFQSPKHEPHNGNVFPNDADDWDLSERVLLYCSRRVQEQEPLNEGNRRTFEDESVKKLTNKIHASAVDTVTDEIRMTISSSQLVSLGRTVSSQRPASSDSGDQKQPAKVTRQMSSGSDAAPDKETCLLAKTSLGAGSISIHLGKLEGRLVSVSVKRRRASSGPGSSGSSVAGGIGNCGIVFSSLPASIILPPSPPPEPVNPSMPSVVIPPTNSAQAGGLRYSRPASIVRLTVRPKCLQKNYRCHYRQEHSLEEFSPPIFNVGRSSIFRSFGCLSTPLAEGRCSAGAVTICSRIEEDGDEASRLVNHLILVSGGTAHEHCLSSTEILSISRPVGYGDIGDGLNGRRASIVSGNSDFESVSNYGCSAGVIALNTRPGPQMKSPRGRFALAALDGTSCIYACGGSNGNEDLSSVECLCFDPKSEYYMKWRYVSSMQQNRSCCAVATWPVESRIMVMGGQFEGSPLSTVEAFYPDLDKWLSFPSMSEARSQLCAATLSQKGLIVAVGGVSETPSTPSTQPTSAVAYPNAHIFESTGLTSSGEAYDPRCSRWIRLPEMLIRGPLIGASLVPLSPTSGRLLLVGGSDGVSTITQTQIFDSRAWSWLPGPSLSIGRASPCAVSLTPPLDHMGGSGTPSIVPYIAVIGGYNLSAGGFLNSVEVVGVAGSSGQISPLTVPLNVSPKGGFVSNSPSDIISDIPVTHSDNPAPPHTSSVSPSSLSSQEEQNDCASRPVGILSIN
ncbi:hypothetical protein Aperf_G00000058196 [Anoplocephala perfoliata]